ncbi:hypothetical protein MHZ92_08795 [Sporosarcina sp. ACRSL]|nr:hypothetical protein [Sporosarcina sp. ACRSL]
MKSRQLRKTFAIFMLSIILSWTILPGIAMADNWLKAGKAINVPDPITGGEAITGGESYTGGEFMAPGDVYTYGSSYEGVFSLTSGTIIIPITAKNNGLFLIPSTLNGTEYGEFLRAGDLISGGQSPTTGQIPGSVGTAPTSGEAVNGGEGPNGGQAGNSGDTLTGGEGPNSGEGAKGGEASTGGDGLSGGEGSTGGDGLSGGEGSAGGDGLSGGEGSTGGDGLSGGEGSTGSDGLSGGEGSTGGDGPIGGEGSTGGDGPIGGEGSTGGDGPTGGEGSAGGDGSTGGEGSAGGDGPTGGDGTTGGEGPNGGTGPTGGDGSADGKTGGGPTIDSEQSHSGSSGSLDESDPFAGGPSMLNALVKSTDGSRGILGHMVGVLRDVKTYWFGFGEKLLGPLAAYQANFNIVPDGKGNYKVMGQRYLKNSVLNHYFQKFKEYTVDGKTRKLNVRLGQDLLDDYHASKKLPIEGNQNKTKWQLAKDAAKSSVDDAINVTSKGFWKPSNIAKLNGPLNVLLSSANSLIDYSDSKWSADPEKSKKGYLSTDFAADITTDVAIGVGITAASSLVGSMAAGAVAGTLVPIPILGTAVGAVVGLGVGLISTALLNTKTGQAVKQFARDSVKAVYDGAVETVKGIWNSGKKFFGNMKSIWGWGS